MDTPKILSVQAFENKNLLIKFVNGVEILMPAFSTSTEKDVNNET
jgi:hypothetical protein